MSQLSIPTRERSFVVDANRGHGQRLVVHADEKLTAFLELENQCRVASAGRIKPPIL